MKLREAIVELVVCLGFCGAIAWLAITIGATVFTAINP